MYAQNIKKLVYEQIQEPDQVGFFGGG